MSNKEFIAKEIAGRTSEKLYEQLSLLKKELFNLRFQKKIGDLKNTSRFLVIRRSVARVKTELVKRSKSGDK